MCVALPVDILSTIHTRKHGARDTCGEPGGSVCWNGNNVARVVSGSLANLASRERGKRKQLTKEKIVV